MKVYAWLIDRFNPPSENCPTGMISGWVQKVTEHRGTIQYWTNISKNLHVFSLRFFFKFYWIFSLHFSTTNSAIQLYFIRNHLLKNVHLETFPCKLLFRLIFVSSSRIVIFFHPRITNIVTQFYLVIYYFSNFRKKILSVWFFWRSGWLQQPPGTRQSPTGRHRLPRQVRPSPSIPTAPPHIPPHSHTNNPPPNIHRKNDRSTTDQRRTGPRLTTKTALIPISWLHPAGHLAHHQSPEQEHRQTYVCRRSSHQSHGGKWDESVAPAHGTGSYQQRVATGRGRCHGLVAVPWVTHGSGHCPNQGRFGFGRGRWTSRCAWGSRREFRHGIGSFEFGQNPVQKFAQFFGWCFAEGRSSLQFAEGFPCEKKILTDLVSKSESVFLFFV